MKLTAVGVDVAKRILQLHWVEPETGEFIGKQIKRAGFPKHFANGEPRPCSFRLTRASAKPDPAAT